MGNIELGAYRELFLEEVDEQLQIMDDNLLLIEQQGEGKEMIQSLFRAAHTIKGSAAAMGVESMKNLTHEMEQILDMVRSRELRVTSGMIDVLFECLDMLRAIKEDLLQGTEISVHIEGLLERLQDMTLNQRNKEIFAYPTMVDLDNNRVKWEIQIAIVSACEMKMARCMVIYNKLQEHAKVIECLPSLDKVLENGNYENLRIICETDMDRSQIEELLHTMMDVERIEVFEWRDQETRVSSSESKATVGPVLQVSNRRNSQSIRVNVEQMEQLMNLVGELVISQTRINQVKANLLKKFNADEDVEELEHVSDTVNRVVSDLQDQIMKARMLPIEQLFNRFPRMVRDLKHDLNKEVDLSLEGTHTELDRSLIEELGDPMIHLIRNALDHGIESSEERLRKGKPAKGRLRIAASHDDNRVVITVEDDGAGIDADRMKQSAVEKGLLQIEEASRLSDQEAVQLIFQAGFSTAAKVSEVSGRGVGMDIVRSDIERLNGLIEIDTTKGKGTRFEIKLPLTLAIITGLLVKLNDRTFIIPMGNVTEILRISLKEIKTVHGEEVIMNRQRVIPLVWLHDRLGVVRDDSIADKKIPLVIVGSAEKRVALAVDELVGNQEIVIKPLGDYVGKTDSISGATILGDGRVAFILDVSDLFNLSWKNKDLH